MKKGNLAVPSSSLLAADLKPETFCRLRVYILTTAPMFEAVQNYSSNTTSKADGFYIGIQG